MVLIQPIRTLILHISSIFAHNKFYFTKVTYVRLHVTP